MSKYKKISAVVIILAGLSIFQNVSAIEYGMLGGKPANPDPSVENSGAWFMYNLKPGETKEDSLLVMNLFEESLNVLIYAADTTKSSSGGFALRQYSEPKDQVGSWVKFYPNEVPEIFQGVFEMKENKIIPFCQMTREDLQKDYGKKELTDDNFSEFDAWCRGTDQIEREMQAKEKSTIPFVFSVPDNADVGEHTGGILIQKVGAEDTSDAGGSAVKLTTRVGVRIYETVPGEIIKKISLDSFAVIKNFKEFNFSSWFGGEKKPEEYLIQSKIKSESNVSIDNENIIHIKDLLFNKSSADIDRNFQVLKQDIFVSNYSWSNPRFGHFSFQTEIKYKDALGQEQKILSDVIKIWVMPWREVVFTIAGLLILMLAYVGWKKYQQKRYGGIGWVEYEIEQNDTVATLSDRHGIDWKVFVRTNKLRPPYLLTVGQNVLVPSTGNDAGRPKKSKKKAVILEKKIDMEATPVKAKKVSTKKEVINKKEVLFKKLAKGSLEKAMVIEKKMFNWKRALLIVVGILVGIGIVAGIIFAVMNRDKKDVVETGKVSMSSVVNDIAQDNGVEPANQTMPIENNPPAVATSVDIAKINIKVLNEGAAPGIAGKIKDFLISKGYVKAEAANGEKKDVVGNTVFYAGDEFQKDAQWIVEMLEGRKVEAEIVKAETGEQTSADIVIVIGK